MRIPAFLYSASILTLVALCGCSALTVPDAPPVSTPIAPVWSESAVRSHLSFLHSDAVRGRADATIGYSIAAAYVSQRLTEYRLQPALSGGFRILHPAARNVVSGARLRYAGGDTLDFVAGLDFLPDGRSASFDGDIGSFWINDIEAAASNPGSVLLWAGPLDPTSEMRFRQSAATVLLKQGPLHAVPSSEQWEGKAILQVSPRVGRRLLSETRRDTARPTRRMLDRPLRLTVAASWSRLASGINVVGFVPGKHPQYAGEAVVICTHLDAVGTFAGVSALDLRNYGVAVASVLEAARQLSRFSRFSRIPERTLIVAFVSGGTVDSSGLAALLESPLWPRDMIKTVIYAGSPVAGIPASLTDRVMSLTVREELALPDTVLLDPALSGLPRVRLRASDPGSASDYMDPAAVAALELAQRIYVHASSELMSSSSPDDLDGNGPREARLSQ